MIVVDGSALIAILRREPEADAFLRIVAEADGCLLTAVSLLETSLVLARRQGDARSWTELDALVAQAGMEVVPQDAALTEVARSAFLRYGKGRHRAGFNLGDCAVYALASSRDLPLLSKGDDFPHTDLRTAA
ncbi:MAG: type II toxin-antitoxin system VapC family toxin [Acetobacteraceae bacterium]